MKNIIGISLFVIYFIQFLIPLEFVYLENLQTIEVYKKWSGLFLFLLILSQWLLTFFRLNKNLSPSKKDLFINIHKWIGVFLPLAFYIHSTSLGFAILLYLSILFFLNIGIGFLNTDKLTETYPKLYNWWVASHIILSVLVLTLAFIHIYIVFIYN